MKFLSKENPSVAEERTKKIDADLKANKSAAGKELKLLLLGAGESGKSTIFKQMKIIHHHGFTVEEKREFVSIIRKHCVENLRDLVAGAISLNLLDKTQAEAQRVVAAMEGEGLTAANVSAMTQLWHSDEMQTAFAQRYKFQLADSARHFFDGLERVAGYEYLPSYEDILACRVRTTGVSEIEFSLDDVKFRMVDVGGQRNERRKWIHCFDDVEAVIFVAAISEYDQVLFEDETTNRLTDALKLFTEICNTKFFTGTSMILFLNKKDLFEQKISTTDLNCCFPDYTGGCDYPTAIEFIKQKFIACRATRSEQEIFVHVTCATSTTNITFVFDSVKESVLMRNVAQSGFM